VSIPLHDHKLLFFVDKYNYILCAVSKSCIHLQHYSHIFTRSFIICFCWCRFKDFSPESLVVCSSFWRRFCCFYGLYFLHIGNLLPLYGQRKNVLSRGYRGLWWSEKKSFRHHHFRKAIRDVNWSRLFAINSFWCFFPRMLFNRPAILFLIPLSSMLLEPQVASLPSSIQGMCRSRWVVFPCTILVRTSVFRQKWKVCSGLNNHTFLNLFFFKS
jgi:hypothetical protein